jgi:hypothetical protein
LNKKKIIFDVLVDGVGRRFLRSAGIRTEPSIWVVSDAIAASAVVAPDSNPGRRLEYRATAARPKNGGARIRIFTDFSAGKLQLATSAKETAATQTATERSV